MEPTNHTVIYNGYKCRIIKIHDNNLYDLETIKVTEKLVIERFSDIPKDEIFFQNKNLEK